VSGDGLTFPLLPRRRVHGLPFGAMRSRSRGAGLDLAGSRPYQVGDDVRRIDWRASARLSSARDADEFLVREHQTEEAAQVVVAVDRGPTMALFPDGTPWLRKPRAAQAVVDLVLASAARAGCRARRYAGDGAERPHEVLEALLAPPSPLGRSSFVFLVSDFLGPPPGEVWARALERGWDVVPVVVQDPVWEQSFPDLRGAIVPLADPASGRIAYVRVSAREGRERRAANEARLAALGERFEELGLDHVLVSSHDPGEVLGAFLDWAHGRHRGARLAG
jgi:uncharacterized protein (DUF58 family)